jgi:hypothetical protein
MITMPVFKIHRMKESHYQQFRWAPHTAGSATVKPKDYEAAGQVEATSVYAAWSELREKGEALRVGDLLEFDNGDLRICKYVGFEEAHWLVPEVKPAQTAVVPGAAPGDAPASDSAPTA